MILVRSVLVLAAALALQAALARLWPPSPRYLDVMALPVVWYASARSQRSGMLIGCVAGLSYDAWFRAGVFGLGGFTKTFFGWAVGAAGNRFDLNRRLSRFVATAVFVWAQGPLELGLRALLDQRTAPSAPLEWTVRAVATGLLAAAVFPILERVVGETREVGYRAR